MTEKQYDEYTKLKKILWQLDKIHPYVLISHDSLHDKVAGEVAVRFRKYIKSEEEYVKKLMKEL